jgi:hypothetical protein
MNRDRHILQGYLDDDETCMQLERFGEGAGRMRYDSINVTQCLNNALAMNPNLRI